MQRGLAAFAAASVPADGSSSAAAPAARLRREAAALEAELAAADALLAEAEARLQRWRGTCERLRSAHAAALTEGI